MSKSFTRERVQKARGEFDQIKGTKNYVEELERERGMLDDILVQLEAQRPSITPMVATLYQAVDGDRADPEWFFSLTDALLYALDNRSVYQIMSYAVPLTAPAVAALLNERTVSYRPIVTQEVWARKEEVAA